MKLFWIDIDKQSKETLEQFSALDKAIFEKDYKDNYKNVFFFYLLAIFGGFLGLHKAYLERNDIAKAYEFTFGLLMIGVIYDLVTGWLQVKAFNEDLSEKLVKKIKAETQVGAAIDMETIDIKTGLGT